MWKSSANLSSQLLLFCWHRRKKYLGHWLSHFPFGVKGKVSTPRKPWGSFLGEFLPKPLTELQSWLGLAKSQASD
jgi:hypothetical protein